MKGVRVIVLAAAAGGLLFSLSVAASDWRQFRGPLGNGISADAAINLDWKTKPPATLWSIPLHDDGWSVPCVGDGRVFVVDYEPALHRDVVRALDLKTGRELWKTPTPGLRESLFGYTGPSPALDHGKLYVISRALMVNCLSADTGSLIWRRDAAKEFAAEAAEARCGYTSSPFIDDQRLIIIPGGSDASVVALDKNTGDTLWKAPGGPTGYASPIIYGAGRDRQLVVFNSEGLISFNPADGKRRWTQLWATTSNQNSATPIIIGKRIFISSAWGVGSALVDIADDKPTLIWRIKDLQSRFSSAVCLNGYIYGVSDPQTPGKLVCLDAVTGETKWKQPGFDYGPIAAAGGALIVVNGKTGGVILVKADGSAYTELGRVQPDTPANAWNQPIIVDGRLLVRNRNTLICLDVSP